MCWSEKAWCMPCKVFEGSLAFFVDGPSSYERTTIMRIEFFDAELLFIYGDDRLCRTIGNLIYGGQYVSNEQIRKQMISLSTRLSDGMDPAKWPEFLRRVRSNMGIRLQREKEAYLENLAFMRAELERMEAGNEELHD